VPVNTRHIYLPWVKCGGIPLIISVAGIILLLLFMQFAQLPDYSLLWREIQNLGHIPLFACIALLCFNLLSHLVKIKNKYRHYSYTLLLSLGIGIAAEWIQFYTGRDAEVGDVLRDFLGIVMALVFCAVIGLYHKERKMQKSYFHQRLFLLLLLLILLVSGLFPLARLSWAYIQRNEAFPVIIDYTQHWPEVFLHKHHVRLSTVDAPALWTAMTGRKVEQIQFEKGGQYPGITLSEPFADWSTYRRLVIDLYTVSVNKLDIRISDRQHNQQYIDRFNASYMLHPGENSIDIPLDKVKRSPHGRMMNMRQIYNMALFTDNIVSPFSIYIKQIRLE